MDTTNPLDIPMPGALDAKNKMHKVPKAVGTLENLIKPIPDISGVGITPLLDRVRAEGITAEKRYQQQEDTSFVDVMKAKFINETALGTGLRRMVAERFADKVDPTYRVDPKELSGFSSREQDWLNSSHNSDDFAARKFDLEDYRDQQDVGDRLGPWVGFAGGFMAGLPEAYISGTAVARGFAAMGARASIAATFGEQVIGNVGLVALQSSYDTHIGLGDYSMALAFSALGTAISIPGIRDAHGFKEEMDRQHAVIDTAAEEKVKKIEQAAKNIGEGATTEQLTAEARRLETQDSKNLTNTGELPEDRHIIPLDDTSTRVDVEQKEVKVEPPTEPVVDKTTVDTTSEVKQDNKPTTPPVLPKELAGAKPRWKTFDINFASDVDKALYITSQAKKSKADSKYREWLKSVGLTDDDITKYGKVIRDNIKKSESDMAAGKPVQEITTPQLVMADRKLNIAPEYKNSLQKMLDNLSTHTRSEISLLATKLRSVLGERNITVMAGTAEQIRSINKGSTPGIERSAYYPMMHTVILETKDTMKGREWVALHEAAHAATIYKIQYAVTNPGTPEAAVLNEINAIRRKAIDVWSALPDTHPAKIDKTVEYYLQPHSTLPVEFTAGLFSTRDGAGTFIDLLRSIKVEGAPLLSKFVAAIKKLLKISPAEDNAFTRALGLTEKMMDTKTNITTSNESFAMAPPTTPAPTISEMLKRPIAREHGLHLLPIDTPAKEAEVKAMITMYEKADKLAPVVDETRLSKLMDTALFSGGQAAANTMLRSVNTLVRWVASELLESPGGAGGRRSTAAIAKHITERRMLGNTLNEVQGFYDTFRKGQGVSAVEDYWGGKTWERFNRLVAEEIEGRRSGVTAVSPEEVQAAANSIEAAFERIRMDQVRAKSVGWASLPETSKGYMPHRMSPEKVINMTMAQKEALHSALTDQFITIEGWDMTFADALASKYINQVERRALGGYDSAIGVHQTGAADIVQDALSSMGMDKEQVTLTMKKLMTAGPGYTKRRIRLDLNQPHPLGDGEFKLMDLFDTDMFSLLRAQASRASGEVALARHGIMGKAHLKLIREAMMQGDNSNRATSRELKAFDQVAAEFLNEPFGTQNKWVDRIMQFNSLARLGGMGFTQAAESINGMVSVGIMKTLSAIGSFGRLRKEIISLSKGETVNNPFLTSLEKFSGAEFGTDAYKIVFPFDNGSLQHQTYGADTITHADRLLRGGSHMQGKLSFWRAFHSTQTRGFAEQIVRKAMEYINAGTNDVALKDMGISDELAGHFRNEMSNIATFKDGRLDSLDITKMENVRAADEFVQAVHRGTSQIIQDTFIGEKGAWAHEGMARLMTQFRTFSLTSIEKQWARQRGNIGTAKSLGIIMAAMAAAVPLYIMRTYVQSIGRKDQEDYLNKRLSYYNMARATMNYVAATGLAGDFLDAGQAISGADFEGNARGGSGGAGAKRFIGNMVAPALGTADDVWKAVQNTKTGTDPTELMKVMPGSRLPYLMPAINMLGN
jgi:hypothetical protein